MKDCLFCKIVKGEIKTEVVYENENAMAFKDINPVAQIHMVIIPKKHIDTAISVVDADATDLIALHKAAKELVEKMGLLAFRLAYNGGKFQHVPHLHMHLLSGEKVEWKKL